MYQPDRQIRAWIVLVLVLSTSMVGVCAPSALCSTAKRVVESVDSQPTNLPQQAACCCGTEDARCCGTGCCLQQSPDPIPTNPPLRSGSERHELRLIAIAAAVNGGLAGSGESASYAAFQHLRGLLAPATLQSQHVRIQT